MILRYSLFNYHLKKNEYSSKRRMIFITAVSTKSASLEVLMSIFDVLSLAINLIYTLSNLRISVWSRRVGSNDKRTIIKEYFVL